MTPKMFLSFMIINEMAWTFNETARLDENESNLYKPKGRYECMFFIKI